MLAALRNIIQHHNLLSELNLAVKEAFLHGKNQLKRIEGYFVILHQWNLYKQTHDSLHHLDDFEIVAIAAACISYNCLEVLQDFFELAFLECDRWCSCILRSHHPFALH
jgi:hypothetical protein